VDRLIRNVDFHVKLSENRVEADIGVNSEKSFSESNRRVLKDRARLIVERTVAIFTLVSLEHSIAAVPNHGFATPANLSQQVRGLTLRDKRLEWKHRLIA